MAVINSPIMLDSTGNKIKNALKEIVSVLNSADKDVHGIVYGFHINSNESDPSAAVTYLEDAAGMTPAKMVYGNTTDSDPFNGSYFDYGSWENAFFMPRPCMVRYNGSVDYYLDPNDYNKKEDGTASDLDTMEHAVKYPGNAMMEWGRNGQKIWTKVVPDEDDPTSGSVYISNKQIDSGYTAYSFVNNQGKLVDHFYTAIYNGSITALYDAVIDETYFKLRSIPYMPVINCFEVNIDSTHGVPLESDPSTLITTTTGPFGTMTNTTKNICLAQNNNILIKQINDTIVNQSTYRNSILWNIEVLCDVQLINNLLVLMGKSLDSQTVFGNGNSSGYNNEDTTKHHGVLYTGSLMNDTATATYEPVYGMNQKGLFIGSDRNCAAVKVFGMENWWGNNSREYFGNIAGTNEYYIKQTFGNEDGSNCIGYNLDGSGYISSDIEIPTADGFISKSKFSNNDNLLLPYSITGGTNSTYYCDMFTYYNTRFSAHGGLNSTIEGYKNMGMFNTFYVNTSSTYWYISSTLSYKPTI